MSASSRPSGVACRNCRYADEVDQKVESSCGVCMGRGEIKLCEADGTTRMIRCDICAGSRVVTAKAVLCRRYAPRQQEPVVWPIVKPTDWCGEYDPRGFTR